MAISLFFGVPGCGKTLGMQNTVAMLSEEWPCFTVESTHEWHVNDIDGNPNPRWRGNPPRIFTIEKGTVEEVYPAIREAVREVGGGVYLFPRVDNWTPFEVATLAGMIGDCYFCDDEIDRFAVYRGWEDNPLREFVHRGRHTMNAEGIPSEVHVLGAARRIQNVHTDLTAMADEAFIFRSQGKRTLSRILEEGYLEADEQIQRVRALPDLSFFRWRNDGTIIEGHIEQL